MKHSYKEHEIETSSGETGGYIQATAKITPNAGYIDSLILMGGFPSAAKAEESVLEQAKTAIDNAIAKRRT